MMRSRLISLDRLDRRGNKRGKTRVMKIQHGVSLTTVVSSKNETELRLPSLGGILRRQDLGQAEGHQSIPEPGVQAPCHTSHMGQHLDSPVPVPILPYANLLQVLPTCIGLWIHVRHHLGTLFTIRMISGNSHPLTRQIHRV